MNCKEDCLNYDWCKNAHGCTDYFDEDDVVVVDVENYCFGFKYKAVVEVKHDACPFCEKYDFSRSKIEVDEDGANIALAICNTKFTKEEQFKYCPACGKKL